jgi:hypothetical protein
MTKTCEYNNCNNQATYCYNDNNWIVKYCKEHKNIEENLIYYRNKYNLCVSCCSILGSFVYENNKKNKFCANCKTDDMISLNKKKCPHDKQKSKCKECGGGSICKHNKQKSQCKECGGSSICKHNIQKSHCKKCGGSAFCEHNIQKRYCKECDGSALCIHDIQKSTCKKCGGSSICIHNNFKSQCKECGGSSICIHNKQKSYCIDCGGSVLCKANKQGILCLQIANKKYKKYCAKCFSNLYPDDPLSLNIRTKSFENKVRDFININYQDFQHNKLLNIGGCDCSHRRFIDNHIIINGCLLAIETDENQHKGYDIDNENNRSNDIMMAYTSPHYFIRFSPNGNYIKDGKKSNPQFATRLKVLKNEIDKAIKFIESEKIYERDNLITNKYLFYNK